MIRPAILWNDGRTTKETAYLNEVIGKETLSKYTANIAFTGFTAPKILWVKENEPELFARIQQKVKEGKWHIMGGWYLQPDCNMPNGESIIRNISEGHRFFEKEFGVRPTTAINFDSFGHSVGLVQIAESGRI